MTGSFDAALALSLVPHAVFAGEKKAAAERESEVTPIKDLMRERRKNCRLSTE
jgi:hypothetical protein